MDTQALSMVVNRVLQVKPGRYIMMWKQLVAQRVLQVIVQVIQPRALPSLDMLHLAHDDEYVSAFLSGSLSDEQQRRIGFNSTVNENVLINRTLWEVSGAHFAPYVCFLTSLLVCYCNLRNTVCCLGGMKHSSQLPPITRTVELGIS